MVVSKDTIAIVFSFIFNVIHYYTDVDGFLAQGSTLVDNFLVQKMYLNHKTNCATNQVLQSAHTFFCKFNMNFLTQWCFGQLLSVWITKTKDIKNDTVTS